LLQRRANRSGHVVFVSKYCIKSTPFTTMAEANTMQFVSNNTPIPVPRVICAFEHAGQAYIVRERISGQNLAQGWAGRSEASKARFYEQLRSIVLQLRSIAPLKNMGVANVNGGPVYDQQFPKQSSWGPFKTIQDFRRELIEVEHLQDPSLAAGLCGLIDFHNQSWAGPVPTHGDLSSLDILARGDERVGIVAWETAGWMPLYWEYTSAWNVNPQNKFWQEVDNYLTPMTHELEMKKIRHRYFGDV
jgi:hypothetical protein